MPARAIPPNPPHSPFVRFRSQTTELQQTERGAAGARDGVPGPAALGRGVVVDGRRSESRRRGRTRHVVTIDDAVARRSRARRSPTLHHAWVDARARSSIVLAVDAERFRAPVVGRRRAVAARRALRGVARPAPLPRLGQHLRRPRAARTRSGGGARKAARLGATEATDDAARRRHARRTARARGSTADRAARSIATRARRRGRARGDASTSARSRRRPATRRGDRRRSRPTSWPRSRTAPGPARIVAPAGSGKTRVLTERLRHLVVDRGLERDGVLAVAYNKKAQLELEERTTDFTPRVSTLNALGYRLLARLHAAARRGCSTSATSAA